MAAQRHSIHLSSLHSSLIEAPRWVKSSSSTHTPPVCERRRVSSYTSAPPSNVTWAKRSLTRVMRAPPRPLHRPERTGARPAATAWAARCRAASASASAPLLRQRVAKGGVERMVELREQRDDATVTAMVRGAIRSGGASPSRRQARPGYCAHRGRQCAGAK